MKTGIKAPWVGALVGVLILVWRAGATEAVDSSGLRPGPATVVADRLNVRGEPRLQAERVGQLQRGDSVQVLEEIVLDKPEPGEPKRWARIALPEGIKVWIHSLFVDPTNRVVLASRLNVRAGPGENHSVLGQLERGDAYEETGVMEGDWIQIEPPADAYAFVAARYLRQEPAAGEAGQQEAKVEKPAPQQPLAEGPETSASAITNVAPPEQELSGPAQQTPEEVTVTHAPELAAPPQEGENQTAAVFSEPPPPDTGTDPAALEKAREAMRQKMAELIARDEAMRSGTAVPPPAEVRMVTREGIVRRAWHILAPTDHALVDLETGRVINYLYTTSTNLDLSRYWGRHVLVTGEEGLDPRWRDTPVLTIRRIQVFP